ncbi:hypothetical protein M405DRAFT_771760 [Rhizopogon salebrosus TDB-379]|nr:hypothetical protein M405DRAFT_771760 [Rhizopogon salebrosus TDB-379]
MTPCPFTEIPCIYIPLYQNLTSFHTSCITTLTRIHGIYHLRWNQSVGTKEHAHFNPRPLPITTSYN